MATLTSTLVLLLVSACAGGSLGGTLNRRETHIRSADNSVNNEKLYKAYWAEYLNLHKDTPFDYYAFKAEFKRRLGICTDLVTPFVTAFTDEVYTVLEPSVLKGDRTFDVSQVCDMMAAPTADLEAHLDPATNAYNFTCPHVVMQAFNIKMVTNICTEEGRATVTKMVESPCFEDGQLKSDVSAAFGACQNLTGGNSETGAEWTCSNVDEWKACMTSATGACGADYTRFWEVNRADYLRLKYFAVKVHQGEPCPAVAPVADATTVADAEAVAVEKRCC